MALAHNAGMCFESLCERACRSRRSKCRGADRSVALTRVLQSLLSEVNATDPLTFNCRNTTAQGGALLACWLPAPTHESRSDRGAPMRMMKEELSECGARNAE